MSETVIITGARAPVAQDLGRACRAAGYKVHFADSTRCHAARAMRPKYPVHRVPPPRQEFEAFTRTMASLIHRTGARAIIPTCEEVFWLAMAAEREGFAGKLYAPDIALLRTLHSKALFAEFAAKIGISVPNTIALDRPMEIGNLPIARNELVLKPEFSRFASHAFIAPSDRQIAAMHPSPTRRWVAQKRLHGEEYCSWAALHDGEIAAFAAYRPRWRKGRAAAFLIEAVDVPAVREVTRKVGAATGMTGHIAFDLILDTAGIAHPIECNPRAVSGLHLLDASPELARAILGGEICAGPAAGALRHMGPAMTLIGLPSALASGRIGEFREDWRRSSDVITRGEGMGVTLGCIRDAAGFAMQAVKAKRSPASATTADIEWDGEDPA